MQKIKSIIVDDERNGRENLRGVLEQYCPEVEIIAEADSALNAIETIQTHKPQLVFLDIEMPDGNGFNVLEFFQSPDFKVIFVTAYDHYAIQAIRFSALDYILKPLDTFKLKEAIRRFIDNQKMEDVRLEAFLKNQNLELQHKKIALPFSDKIEYITVKDIVFCQGEANYTHIHLNDGKKLLVSKPLIEIEEILSGFEFIRTHKTYVINKKHVSSFIKSDGGYLKMNNGTSIPVSRRKKDWVLQELKN